MNKAKVILNEQHSLLPEQEKILNKRYSQIDIISVPSTGWTAKEMKKKAVEVTAEEGFEVVFASPIPLMIKMVHSHIGGLMKIFHNDMREKKELPNGKVIMVVAQTGWQLL